MTGLKPFDPQAILLIGLLNPAVILVAILMGRAADQWQKIIVAGFAAALAGSALIWVGAYLKIVPARGVGGEAGLFVVQLVLGLLWASAAYVAMRRRG